MKLDWDASGTQLQAGDYFDIDLPQTMNFHQIQQLMISML